MAFGKKVSDIVIKASIFPLTYVKMNEGMLVALGYVDRVFSHDMSPLADST